MEVEEDQVDGGLARTVKDLFAGAAGGIAQVLLGQPFGTFGLGKLPRQW
jgi:solute carrier family 25 carnitine/acylcarnitine transporter 20/29